MQKTRAMVNGRIAGTLANVAGLKEQVRSSAGKLLVKMENNRKEHSIYIVFIDGNTETKL